MFGIDLSHWDDDVNYREIWDVCDFVIIKATDGTKKDPAYMTHYNQTLPLKTGFYAYTYATTAEKARDEARAFYAAIKPCKAEMGYWLDVEDKRLKNLTKEALTDILNAWLQEAKKLGLEVGIYSNPDWLERRIDLTSLAATKLWLAVWTNDITKLLKYRQKYLPDVIQYTDAYKLPNKAKVDGNIVL